MRNFSLCIACTGVGAGLGVGTINAVAEAAKSGSGYLAAAVVGLPVLAAVAGAVGFGLVGSLHGVGMRDMGDAERPREAAGEGAIFVKNTAVLLKCRG